MSGGGVIVRRAQSAESCRGHHGTEAGTCAEVVAVFVPPLHRLFSPISSFGPPRGVPFGLVIARRIFVSVFGPKWMVGTRGDGRMHG